MSEVVRKSMFRSSIIVSAATMLSRVLGLVRDIVFAVLFGSGGAQDAFFVAFKIPNFLRRLFAEGAFNQAFVPVLSEYRHAEGDASVRKLVSAVQIYLGAIVGVVTLLAVLGSPIVAWLFASGFHDDGVKLDQVAGFLRITFPYLWFISLTALGSSVLNSYQQFAAPALAPVILNLCLIGSALFLSPWFEVAQTGIAWGVFFAGLLQWVFLWPSLMKTGVWTLRDWRAQHPGVRKIMVLMVPGLFAVSVSQINLLLDTLLATWLADGSVGWLYYSDRLTELPLGVIGVAIGTVLLPRLSALHAESDGSMFERTLAWAIRLVLLIGLPAMVALLVMPDVLLSLLFGHGEFTARDVQAASGSLAAYAVGLPAFMLIKILAPGFFSRQDTKTPVKIAVKAMFWNMVFNILLIVPLAHVGLALATSLSAWLNASLLAWHLRKDNRLPPLGTLVPSILRIALASVVMGAVLWWLLTLTFFSSATGIVMETLSVALLVGCGLVVYALTALGLGIRPALLRHP